MDAIVVSDQKTAIECIRYMKDQRAGQATFLPLDSITVKPINEKYRTFSKGAQLAIDLLESDGSIDVALQFACGSSLVCDTLEVAKYVCYEKKQEVKGMTVLK
jgi:structural maintenance of chromosome 1